MEEPNFLKKTFPWQIRDKIFNKDLWEKFYTDDYNDHIMPMGGGEKAHKYIFQ